MAIATSARGLVVELGDEPPEAILADFDIDGSELKAAHREWLREEILAPVLAADGGGGGPTWVVELQGRASRTADAVHNFRLSQARAMSALRFLREIQGEGAVLTPTAVGESLSEFGDATELPLDRAVVVRTTAVDGRNGPEPAAGAPLRVAARLGDGGAGGPSPVQTERRPRRTSETERRRPRRSSHTERRRPVAAGGSGRPTVRAPERKLMKLRVVRLRDDALTFPGPWGASAGLSNREMVLQVWDTWRDLCAFYLAAFSGPSLGLAVPVIGARRSRAGGGKPRADMTLVHRAGPWNPFGAPRRTGFDDLSGLMLVGDSVSINLLVWKWSADPSLQFGPKDGPMSLRFRISDLQVGDVAGTAPPSLAGVTAGMAAPGRIRMIPDSARPFFGD